MSPKPTKGYVMPVKQGAYEKVNAAVKDALLEFGMSDSEASRLVTALVQKKIPFTRIDNSRNSWIKHNKSHIRYPKQ